MIGQRWPFPARPFNDDSFLRFPCQLLWPLPRPVFSNGRNRWLRQQCGWHPVSHAPVISSLTDYGGEPMKKQTILVGFITAAFILVATGASFAGDRRLHRPGGNHWKGKNFAAQRHNGHYTRGHQVRHPRANWKGRDHNPSRRGWSSQRSAHQRPGQYGHRPHMRRNNDRHPAGASFRRQHEGRGDRGHANNQPAISRGDRQDGRGHDTAVASDDTQSRRGGRDRDASGRQRRAEAEL